VSPGTSTLNPTDDGKNRRVGGLLLTIAVASALVVGIDAAVQIVGRGLVVHALLEGRAGGNDEAGQVPARRRSAELLPVER
jgi:hypothetical protein